MGYSFYINSYKSLRNKSANMDVLIALGTTAAWANGIAHIILGFDEEDMMDDHMYREMVVMLTHNFDISSLLITIIIIGKFLESYSKKKTVDKLSQLASLKVTKANLIKVPPGGVMSLDAPDAEIEVELLQVNDLIKIYPGSGVPVDGVVVFGKGATNESMLTGESLAVVKEQSSKVYGGSVLL
mmetsp:Transcript_47277/g.34566  ORF Transcript_47277/g.34566 Transcript_47277/m.34566 type:complete len:184 (+) Transcript_47277:829-1380(+)